MRYWHPFIRETIEKIVQDGINELVVLSLYPHYSKTTTGSALSEFKRSLKEIHNAGPTIRIHYITEWYDFPPYIDALTKRIYESLSNFGDQNPVLLYSAHSIPLSFVKEGDPYPGHIKTTVELLNRRLSAEPYNINGFKWYISYQSRMRKGDWLGPSTEETLVRLSGEGYKNVLVVPVSFVSDHIETLYEIGIYYRDIAIKRGINLRRCPSLNTSEEFIEALGALVSEKVGIE